jgi:hypothetical protein
LLQARFLLRGCDCRVVDQNQAGSHLDRLVEAECRYARKGSNPNITRVSDAYSNTGCKLCVCSFAAAVRRSSKTRQLSFWASDRGGMPIDCRREQSIMPRSRASGRRTSVPVLRSAAAALKHCRQSATMRFDFSNADMSCSFEQASQGLAAHTGARLQREVSRDVTINRISKLMMSNKRCIGVSCWSSHRPGA